MGENRGAELDWMMEQEEQERRRAFDKALGERVREARQARKFTGEDTAEMAGITTQFLSNVERGKKGISAYKLADLARALGVTADYLIWGREDVDAGVLMAAEYLASIPPAQRDMAVEMMELALKLIREGIPKEG